MRTPLLATLLGLNLVACAGNISGGPGDDDIPETCGNGQVDPGEDCDGTEGCTASCTMDPSAVTRLDVTTDKPGGVMTELGSTNMVTVAMQGGGGYAGSVTVNATVVDASNNPLPGWTATVNPPTQTLATNGSGSAVVTVLIPSENKGLAASLKITTTTTAVDGVHDATTAFTVANQVTFTMTSNNGQCVYPGTAGLVTNVTAGTKVRFLNNSADPNFTLIVHSNGGGHGVAHQDTGTTTAKGVAYEQTAATPNGTDFDWYCHAPGPDLSNVAGVNNNPHILVTAP